VVTISTRGDWATVSTERGERGPRCSSDRDAPGKADHKGHLGGKAAEELIDCAIPRLARGHVELSS
jgi:hypothetical protein